MRLLPIAAAVLSVFPLASAVFAQSAADPQSTAACSFDDGKEMSVRYNPNAAGHDRELPNGKVFPDTNPMLLFTQGTITLGGSAIPAGAFSMYVIPGKEDWTLVVNRNVTPGAQYSQTEDLARASMQTAKLDTPLAHLKVSLGHMGAQQCEIRVYYGKTGAWAEIKEQ